MFACGEVAFHASRRNPMLSQELREDDFEQSVRGN